MKKLGLVLGFLGVLCFFCGQAYAIDFVSPSITYFRPYVNLIPPPVYKYEFIAFGDSITFGMGDDKTEDGTGFQPILSKLLSSRTKWYTVHNEGQPGATSAWGNDNIERILLKEEYKNVSHVLIQFGTNDALNQNVGTWAFEQNMADIIDKVIDAGKTPLLARAPMIYGPCMNLNSCAPFSEPWSEKVNKDIREFNEIIIRLADQYDMRNAQGGEFIPPNFFYMFDRLYSDDINMPVYFSDYYHPNGDGYEYMAEIWRDHLLGDYGRYPF